MIHLLPPWHANVGKRLVKAPKLYIRDSGRFHALHTIATPVELDSHPKRGHRARQTICAGCDFEFSRQTSDVVARLLVAHRETLGPRVGIVTGHNSRMEILRRRVVDGSPSLVGQTVPSRPLYAASRRSGWHMQCTPPPAQVYIVMSGS